MAGIPVSLSSASTKFRTSARTIRFAINPLRKTTPLPTTITSPTGPTAPTASRRPSAAFLASLGPSHLQPLGPISVPRGPDSGLCLAPSPHQPMSPPHVRITATDGAAAPRDHRPVEETRDRTGTPRPRFLQSNVRNPKTQWRLSSSVQFKETQSVSPPTTQVQARVPEQHFNKPKIFIFLISINISSFSYYFFI